jgi:hypothetical protein
MSNVSNRISFVALTLVLAFAFSACKPQPILKPIGGAETPPQATAIAPVQAAPVVLAAPTTVVLPPPEAPPRQDVAPAPAPPIIDQQPVVAPQRPVLIKRYEIPFTNEAQADCISKSTEKTRYMTAEHGDGKAWCEVYDISRIPGEQSVAMYSVLHAQRWEV